MNCIIIDDEPLAREGMALLVKKLPQLKLIGAFSNPLDAAEILQKSTSKPPSFGGIEGGQQVDLLFLDINMPEMNGLDFMKTLVNKPLVILATAYPQYALDSYELEVVDYLLKPIRLERFLKAVNKAQNYFDLLQAKDVQPNKIENIGHDFVYIKADRKYFKIFFNQILYIEGLKDYVIIYTEDQKVVTAMNLKTIFDQLPAAVFARISKSYIVNTNKITSFDSFNVYINDTELSLGQRFKDDFFKNFVEQKIAKR